ncbi:MAG: alpha/beta hydrolase [Candidatus Bathyarchaeota archaeon]|nr:alpha/beta hydrolase [Candidatus Bathyarchaeota archaeon]
MKSGFVEVDEHRIRYYKYGERGPKIVLLHGFGHFTQSLNFKNFLENMSDSYQILAFDLLAHGKSSNPLSPIGYEQHAGIMHQAAIELGYTKYNLIGYSFGGMISMRLASLYGENIEKLVIVDITPRTYATPQHVTSEQDIPFEFRDTESAVDWISERLPDVPRAFWYGNLDSLFFKEENDAWSMSSHPSRKTQLVQDGDGWRYFKNIKVPTMIVRGSESHSAVEEEVDRMTMLMSDLHVETIDGADHNVPFTHSDQFEKAIREFISI